MSVLQQNRRKRIRLGEDNNALTWLIIINAVVFAAALFISVIYSISYDKPLVAQQLFHTQFFDWLTLPASPAKFITRPWVLFTFMFTHEGVMLLISSVLWLWGFGYILQDISGNDKLIPVYLYGGFAGAVFFLLAANFLPYINSHFAMPAPLLGAGTSVMAVAIATTTLAPTYKIFPMINGGIPLWVLTLVYVAIDYVSIGGSNAPVAFAHLAAGTIGFIYMMQLKRGNDMGKWMTDLVNWLNNIFNPEKKQALPKQQQHFYKATRKPFEKTTHVTQQRLDEILDKINKDGYHFLTDEEKDFLKKASHEDL